MDEKRDPLLMFLADMGIEAKMITSNTLEKLIAIPSTQYHQHRKWVETWFTLVEEHEGFCYVRERMRGTGDTL